MIAKKLKFLLKPPIPSLFLSGVGFVALELASRVSAWGTIAWFLYTVYLYFAQVRGRGKMGISFAIFSLVSLWVIRGVEGGIFLYATALCVVALLVLFLGSIGYRFSRHETILPLFYYVAIGMNIAWWASKALLSFSFFSTLLVWGSVYLLVRDRNRFLTQQWNKEDTLIYLLFTFLSIQYAWGITLLPVSPLDVAALFLVFFVVGDDSISIGRIHTITREYIYKNLGLYIGCSVAILVLSSWF